MLLTGPWVAQASPRWAVPGFLSLGERAALENGRRSGEELGSWELRKEQRRRSLLLQVLAVVGVGRGSNCQASFDRTVWTSLIWAHLTEAQMSGLTVHFPALGLVFEERAHHAPTTTVNLESQHRSLASAWLLVTGDQTGKHPFAVTPLSLTFSSLIAVKQLANGSFMS